MWWNSNLFQLFILLPCFVLSFVLFCSFFFHLSCFLPLLHSFVTFCSISSPSYFVPVIIIIPFKHIHQLTIEFSQESENPYNTSSGSESILLFWISDVNWYAEWVEMNWFCYWHPTFTLMNFWWQNDTKIHMWEAKIKMLWYICTFVW